MTEIKINVEAIGKEDNGDSIFALVCRDKNYILLLTTEEEKCFDCGNELNCSVKLFNGESKKFDRYVCSKCLPKHNNGKGLPEISIFNS